MASVTSVADVVNLSLRNIGYELRVANLYEGSKAANTALDIYGQTRDAFMRDGEWPFLQHTAAGVVVKTAPANYFDTPWTNAYPPPPWLFTYQYPADCLRVGLVRPKPQFFLEMEPLPVLWSIINDGGDRVIAANIAEALIVYKRRVTDPADWPPDFVEAFAAVLANKLKVGLDQGDLDQLGVAITQTVVAAAAQERG